MNELQDDASANDPVIARLRSALDEVTAESDGLMALEAPRPKVGVGRWMAVAAATVLIVGAVTAIAINRNHAPEVSTAPTELPTTSPDTTVVAKEPELIRTETPGFRLVAPDLVPGERTLEQCCRASLPGRQLVMAWSAPNVPAYLMVTEFPDPGPSIVVGATQREGPAALHELALCLQVLAVRAQPRAQDLGVAVGVKGALVRRAQQVLQVDLLGFVLEDRRLDGAIQELLGMAAEVLVQGVLARDVDR